MICLDEMGPEGAKSHPGRHLVRPAPGDGRPAERATQGADYGRRGKGDIFGAFRPATGEAFTQPYAGRTTVNWVDFLERVEGWLPAEAAQVYAIVDNLNTHHATDVLLFALAHPRWEFVFQPTYAAYRNLIEPWWKTLRSLALKGRCARRPPTGIPIAIPSSGGVAAATAHAVAPAARSPRMSGRLAGCTT